MGTSYILGVPDHQNELDDNYYELPYKDKIEKMHGLWSYQIGGLWHNFVWAHHLVVFVVDDVAVPDVSRSNCRIEGV